MASESTRSFLWFLIISTILSLSCTEAHNHKFYVGGKDGWVTKPSEYYTHWAQRYRFHVNDTLSFKFNKGSDSVLVVKKEDYDSCNTESPIQKMDDGDSSFTFNGSGPFYFISGEGDHCVKGQKLNVVVMAARVTPQPQPHQQSPPPVAAASPPPSATPEAKSPTPATGSPGSGSPEPSEDPAPAPAPSGSMRVGVGGSVGVALGVMISMVVN